MVFEKTIRGFYEITRYCTFSVHGNLIVYVNKGDVWFDRLDVMMLARIASVWKNIFGWLSTYVTLNTFVPQLYLRYVG